ncbi:hypothetical protein, partial [Escherichia coli]|uniref:hypothetical protein n=1 Tax=Escherichia coli TaxID=562 RepID=UPI003F7F91D9
EPVKTSMVSLCEQLSKLGIWTRLHYVYPYPHVDVDVTRFSGLNGIEDNRSGIRTGMLGNHRNIVALTPDLKLFNRCRTESIACRLLRLTRRAGNA